MASQRAHVVGVFAGKYHYTALFHFTAGEWLSNSDVCGDQQRDCGLAVTGAAGERIAVTALEQAVD